MSVRNRQRGVGLIEILVAVVIIAIGFLAAARMQVESMRFSQGAYYRSQAYFMATDMIDRMRTNVEGVKGRFYDGREAGAGGAAPDCTVDACTPQQIADLDLAAWSAKLFANGAGDAADFIPLLPSVDGFPAGAEIVRDAPGRYTIRVTWGEIIDNEPTESVLTIAFVAES